MITVSVRQPSCYIITGKSKATVIPLSAISKVRGNQQGSVMYVYYTANGKSRMTNIGFANSETRDEVLTALQQRLGSGFSMKVQELNSFQSAIKPGIALLVVGFFVVLFYMGFLDFTPGEDYHIHGHGALFKGIYLGLVSLLGPTGILILGGLILLPLVIWFARRVANPPTQMTLARTK